MSALPIFPGRHQPSIFGASELNCRVRDGNGWTLTAISTDFVAASSISLASACGQSSLISLRLLPKSKPLRWALILFQGHAFIRTLSIFQPVSRSKPIQLKNGDPWESRTPVCGVRGRRLDHLTNGPCRLPFFFFVSLLGASHPRGSGTPSGTRTLDTLIKSQVLYQLS